MKTNKASRRKVTEHVVLGMAVCLFAAPLIVGASVQRHGAMFGHVDLSRAACQLGQGLAIAGEVSLTCDPNDSLDSPASKPCSIGDGISILGHADITCALIPANDLALVL
jgi:hypothetical protein